MASIVSIECPPLIKLSNSTVELANEVMSYLSILSKSHTADADIFVGSEIRYAFRALHCGKDISTDNNFWKLKFHKLLFRPAMEPIAFLFKDKIDFGQLNLAIVNAIASFLLGRQAMKREGSTIGRSSGITVRFEAVATAQLWPNDITTAFTYRDLRSVFPAYCFLRVICAHPFDDGNGRLARMLAQLAIMGLAGAKVPLLPLAPIMYENAATLGDAIIKSSETRSCEPFFLAFYSVIRSTLPKLSNL